MSVMAFLFFVLTHSTIDILHVLLVFMSATITVFSFKNFLPSHDKYCNYYWPSD